MVIKHVHSIQRGNPHHGPTRVVFLESPHCHIFYNTENLGKWVDNSVGLERQIRWVFCASISSLWSNVGFGTWFN